MILNHSENGNLQKKIKLEEFYELHLDYASKNQDQIKLKSNKGYPLYYVYGEYYIFSTVTYVRKMGRMNLTGIGVDANTGKLKFINIPSEENYTTEGKIWCSYNENR